MIGFVIVNFDLENHKRTLCIKINKFMSLTMYIKFVFCILLLLMSNSSRCQEFSYGGYEMRKVAFQVPDEGSSHWIKIFNDPVATYSAATVVSLPGAISGDSETAVYCAGVPLAPSPIPVAYVSGCHGKVFATLSSGCLEEFYVRGETDEGFNLPWNKAEFNPIIGLYEYGPVAFNEIFTADQVRYFEKFTIKWYISVDPYGAGEMIGETELDLFVTHKMPVLKDLTLVQRNNECLIL